MGFLPTAVTDTLQNLASGLGLAGKDKATAAQFVHATMLPQELQAAYRSDWMAKKIVNIPAFDEVRAWRAWQADKKQITALEKEEKRLNVRGKVLQARIMARLHGGGTIVVDDGRPMVTPLQVTKAQGIKALLVLSRYRMTPVDLQWDPSKPNFMGVTYFNMSTPSGVFPIHPSRVIVFKGAEIPDTDGNLSITDRVYGDSKLQAVKDAVLHAATASQAIATLLQEASVDVIKVDGLMSQVGSEEYRKRFLARWELAATMKSISNALIMDKLEDYEKKQVSFATLPDVQSTFWQAVCGAADIPQTRFMGQAPKGMNATGESDAENYNVMINAAQTMELDPAMSEFNEALIVSALGDRPEEIHFVWNPLTTLSQKDKADVGYKNAQRDKIYADAGLIPEAALQEGVQNALIESGVYPGLEQAIEDAESGKLLPFQPVGPDGEPIDPATQGVGPDGKPLADPTKPGAKTADPGNDNHEVTVSGPGGLSIKAKVRKAAAKDALTLDAAPRSLYVSRRLLNAPDVIAWAKAQGFDTTMGDGDLHVTVAYSKTPIDWMKVGRDWSEDQDGQVRVAPGGPRVVERLGAEGKATVLTFSSESLGWRHQRIVEAGGSWDWPSYQPHVTVSWDADKVDLAKVTPYAGPLVFGPEIFQEIVEDWRTTVKEG